MSFVVHTEALNLVSAVAEAENNDDDSVDSTLHASTLSSRVHELKHLWDLALPTIIIQLGTVVPGFLTASYIGRHYDVVYLDGFMLATLTGNLFTLTLLQGLYSASDTLSPQAYGAGNSKEVGYLAIRGFAGSLIVTLPIILILVVFMEDILVSLGIDAEASELASIWYKIYIIAMPFYVLYQVTWKFLSAQNVMFPLVICELMSCCFVLPIALYASGAWLGFPGTAVAILFFMIVQALSLILYLWWFQPYDASTWTGLQWKAALQIKPFCAYMALGAGGMLASSEWIYWELLSLIIGTLGVVPLSVHTIATQVVTVFFMLPLGFGIALAIRLGATLPISVARAKQTVHDCLLIGTLMFGAAVTWMYIERHFIYRMFTTEEHVIAGLEEIWGKICLYNFVLSLFGMNMGACIGLGIQWILGITAILTLWAVGLPAAYFWTVVRGGGLNGAWSCIWPPYTVINFVLVVAFLNVDWYAIQANIREREGSMHLESPLMPKRHPADRFSSLNNNGTQNKHDKTYGSI
jgi:MATE family multidrug resistance protein